MKTPNPCKKFLHLISQLVCRIHWEQTTVNSRRMRRSEPFKRDDKTRDIALGEYEKHKSSTESFLEFKGFFLVVMVTKKFILAYLKFFIGFEIVMVEIVWS